MVRYFTRASINSGVDLPEDATNPISPARISRGSGRSRMYRAIVVLAVMAGLALYVRHQYQNVIQQVTKGSSSNRPMQADQSRRRCVLCGATGRSVVLSFGAPGASRSDICQSCNGTGWVDNAVFGR